MPPLQEYIEQVDDLLQRVTDTYASWVATGHIADIPAELRTLAEKGFRYRDAKRVADDRRENDVRLSEKEADEETTTRNDFAMAYREHRETKSLSWLEK